MLATTAALWPMAGCADESRTVHLLVDSDLAVPDEVDLLEVTVTASESAEPRTCSPATFPVELLSAGDDEGGPWPVRVAVLAGDRFPAWLAFRIVGRSLGDEVIRREGRVPWPSSGSREVDVVLSSRCYRRLCGRNEHCVDGQCLGVPEPDLFEHGLAEEAQEPCVEHRG